MRKIELNLSCGLHRIPGIIFNKCHEALALPMSLLWSEALEVGKIPQVQKRSLVIPALKPDSDHLDLASYRPLSLTFHISIPCTQ